MRVVLRKHVFSSFYKFWSDVIEAIEDMFLCTCIEYPEHATAIRIQLDVCQIHCFRIIMTYFVIICADKYTILLILLYICEHTGSVKFEDKLQVTSDNLLRWNLLVGLFRPVSLSLQTLFRNSSATHILHPSIFQYSFLSEVLFSVFLWKVCSF